MKHLYTALAITFALPFWGQEMAPVDSDAAAEALQQYSTYAQALPDSTRSHKLFGRWSYFWEGRLDNAHSPQTLFDSYRSWQPCNMGLEWTFAGPTGIPTQHQGRIECIAWPEDGFLEELLVGTPTAGIWRSSEGGASWTNVTDDDWTLPGMGCSWITYAPNDPATVYAAITVSTTAEVSTVGIEHGYGLGIFKSSDGGESWAPTNFHFAPEDRQLTTRILANPNDGLDMYAAVNGQVYRTLDGWNTWSLVFDQLTQSYPFRRKTVTDLAADPNDFNSLWVGSNGVESWTYQSNPTNPEEHRYHAAELWHGTQLNGNASWQRIESSMHPSTYLLYDNSSQASKVEVEVTADLITIGYKLYAGSAYFWQSSDGGETWTQKAEHPMDSVDGVYQFSMVVDPNDPATIYAGQRRVYRIPLDGISSAEVLYGPHVDTRFLQVWENAPDGQTVLLQGNDGGATRIDYNDGFSWTNLNGQGLNVQQIFGLGLVQEPNPRVVCGSQDNSGFRNQSTGWDQYLGGDRYNPIVHPDGHGVFPVNPSGLTEFSDIHGYTYAPIGQDPTGGNYYHRPMASDTLGHSYAAYSDLWQWNGPGTDWVQKSELDTRRLRAADVSACGEIALVAEQGATWGGAEGKLFHTASLHTAIPLWTDITPHIADGIGHMGVNALCIHPLDPHLVAVGFENFDQGEPENRVLMLQFSEDYSACTTTAIGHNLPNVPINTLRFEPQPEPVLWAGNDLGVFRFTDTWECLKGNLPATFITDIEFDLFAGKVWVSTFGRGLWTAPLDCSTAGSTSLTSNQSWNSVHRIASQIVIPSGVELTISGTVFFTPDAGIQVEPGGRLVVDGGQLRSACPDEFWQGIVALGQPEAHQIPVHQARVILRDDALIHGARIGVSCGMNGLAGGAWLDAVDASFVDCIAGVEIHPYRDQTAALDHLPQKSQLNRCTFLWTEAFPASVEPMHHVLLDRVNTVDLLGCAFIGNGQHTSGIGLRTRNAQWRVLPSDGSSIIPCRFEGLNRGIDARSWLDTETFALHGAEFSNNTYGLRAISVMHASIRDNDFSIGAASMDQEVPPYGAHLLGCSGYWVEGNTFSGNQLSTENAGLIITDSEDAPNQVYRNTFVQLEWACLAQGDNRDHSPNPESTWDPSAEFSGLQFLCNQFEANGYDISVTDNGAIAHYQGNPNPLSPWGVFPAHNLWSEGPCADNNLLHVNADCEGFEYFFPEVEAALIPPLACYSNPLVGLMELQPEILPYENFVYDQVCLSTQEVSNVTDLLQDANEDWTQWEDMDDVMDGLVDLGNTETLLSLVTDPNEEAKTLRIAIQSSAPWTSTEVLLALIEAPQLNEVDRYSLLIDHAPLPPAVLEAAENHWGAESFWFEQLFALNHTAQPNTYTKHKAQLAGWRARAHSKTTRAVNTGLLEAEQMIGTTPGQDAASQRLRFARLAKSNRAVGPLEDYPATDAFTLLYANAEGWCPDDQLSPPPANDSWRSLALHSGLKAIAEPFSPPKGSLRSLPLESRQLDGPQPYPNPSSSGWQMPAGDAGKRWSVINVSGKLVDDGTLQNGPWFLNGEHWAKGTYLVQYHTEGNEANWLLIRE